MGIEGGAPNCMIRFAFYIHPEQANETDECGNYPLHIAAANPTLKQEKSRFVINNLLQMNPGAAFVASCGSFGKRMPLTLAIVAGSKTWDTCVEAIFMCNELAVTEKDPETGLYPFMLAASVMKDGRGCLNTTFQLLRSFPDLNSYQ
uniref:Uncharacterized protein n=1 Tax=Proboscia inermis TaxID=420281 RepID=A0A7S0CHH3_9STRA